MTPLGRIKHTVDRKRACLRSSLPACPLATQPQLTEPLLLVARVSRVHTHRVENILRELNVLLSKRCRSTQQKQTYQYYISQPCFHYNIFLLFADSPIRGFANLRICTPYFRLINTCPLNARS